MERNRKNIFLSEKFILLVIIINSIIIFLQESGISNPVLDALDALCTIIFIIEMVTKHRQLGLKGYWSSGWNRLDGTLVILSIPSLVNSIFVDAMVSDNNDALEEEVKALSDKIDILTEELRKK